MVGRVGRFGDLTLTHRSFKAGFDQYCDDLANTAVWGGGLELRALALLLARPIKVYQAHGSMLEVGEGSEEPLRISYHRHALALGAHYNSLRKGA